MFKIKTKKEGLKVNNEEELVYICHCDDKMTEFRDK